MNRRRFLQSLVSVFSLPAATALPFSPATAAMPTAAAVPTQARFWAIYMSGIHGECTPKALQNMLNIPELDAKQYISRLLADGVIKSNPLLQGSVPKILKSNEDSILDKVKKRSEMKAQAKVEEWEICEPVDETDFLDPESERLEDEPEINQEGVSEDERVEAKTQQKSET